MAMKIGVAVGLLTACGLALGKGAFNVGVRDDVEIHDCWICYNNYLILETLKYACSVMMKSKVRIADESLLDEVSSKMTHPAARKLKKYQYLL